MKKRMVWITILSLLGICGVDAEECCQDSCGQLTFGGDWLYWRATQDSLEYGAQVHGSSIPSTGGFAIQSTVLRPNFEPSSGFRVLADYAYPKWHVTAAYSRLLSSSRITNSIPGGVSDMDFIVLNSTSFPIFNVFNDNSGFRFSDVSSLWSFSLNYLDIDFAYNFCPFTCLTLSPHLGLRGLWIKEKLFLNGNGVNSEDDPGSFFTSLRGCTDGYGVQGGLQGNLAVGWGFSFIANLGASLLYSQIKAAEHLTLMDEEGELVGDLRVHDCVFHLTPTLDGFLGVQYLTCWCSHPVELHLGWEQHVIFNINHFSIFSYSDLTIQGVTLGGSVSF